MAWSLPLATKVASPLRSPETAVFEREIRWRTELTPKDGMRPPREGLESNDTSAESSSIEEGKAPVSPQESHLITGKPHVAHTDGI
jgi:hypothetical protein